MLTANTKSMINFCIGLLVVVVCSLPARGIAGAKQRAVGATPAGRLPQHIDDHGAGMDGQG